MKTIEIPCNFVGSFKVGDNLVFNSQILEKLVEKNEDGIFNKLIVLHIGSILEASLAQIIYRAQHFSREGVPNISESDRAEIAGKKVDKFNSIIDVLKKYAVLDGVDGNVYDELHKLRKFRNKIHIQDDIEIEDVPRDDDAAFSDEIRDWALGLHLRVIDHLSSKLPRPKQLHVYVALLRAPEP